MNHFENTVGAVLNISAPGVPVGFRDLDREKSNTLPKEGYPNMKRRNIVSAYWWASILLTPACRR